MAELVDAYNELADPVKRRAYDLSIKRGFNATTANNPSGSSASSSTSSASTSSNVPPNDPFANDPTIQHLRRSQAENRERARLAQEAMNAKLEEFINIIATIEREAKEEYEAKLTPFQLFLLRLEERYDKRKLRRQQEANKSTPKEKYGIEDKKLAKTLDRIEAGEDELISALIESSNFNTATGVMVLNALVKMKKLQNDNDALAKLIAQKIVISTKHGLEAMLLLIENGHARTKDVQAFNGKKPIVNSNAIFVKIINELNYKSDAAVTVFKALAASNSFDSELGSDAIAKVVKHFGLRVDGILPPENVPPVLEALQHARIIDDRCQPYRDNLFHRFMHL